MKKSEFKFDFATIKNGSKDARMVPFVAGDVLHFTLNHGLFKDRAETIDGTLQEWTDIISDEGDNISMTQLTRRRNGLVLEGTTISERTASFVSLFNEDGTLTLRITGVVERNFIQDDGRVSPSRYLRFAVV